MATQLQIDWMKRTLGFDGSVGQDVLAERLQVVREDTQRLGAGSQFAAALGEAGAAVQAGDAHAAALLDSLEQGLAAFAGSQRAAAAAATMAALQTAGGAGVVEFAKLRLELEKARGHFDGATDELKSSFKALLETDDFLDDPRSSDPATLAAIDAIGQKLPSFPQLADLVHGLIDEMSNASEPKQRRAHGDTALKAIDGFRARVDATEVLTEMENTDAGTFAIHSRIAAALDGLAAALRG